MTTIKLVHSTGPSYDCELCGSHYDETTTVFFNDVEVWESYTDNHMTNTQTELSVHDAILDEWRKQEEARIHAEHTEEKRLEWDANHPGNAIAANKANWNDAMQSCLKSCSDSYFELSDCFRSMPYQQHLAIKLVAIWIEAITGYEVTVEIVEEIAKDDYDV